MYAYNALSNNYFLLNYTTINIIATIYSFCRIVGMSFLAAIGILLVVLGCALPEFHTMKG